MTTAYIKILAELSNADPPDITIPSIPYDITMSIDAQVDITYSELLQATRQGKKQKTLAYAFYLGQLLEVFTTSPAQRTILRSRLTKYYALAHVNLLKGEL